MTNYTNGTPTNYFVANDANGNVAALVNASTGALAQVYEYSPFGELLRSENLDAAVGDNPFRFSTKFTDSETGLVYYGARYYSPALGRFINRDPIEEAGGVNLYGFCGNDGVNEYDYLGNSWLSKFWNKYRHTIISTAIRVVGDYLGGWGEYAAAAYNVAVGYSYGGARGAAWAAVGSYAGAGSGCTNFAATSYSLYSTFGHGGNIFTNFRNFGENYLVAQGTSSIAAGVMSEANGAGFAAGFTKSIPLRVRVAYNHVHDFFLGMPQDNRTAEIQIGDMTVVDDSVANEAVNPQSSENGAPASLPSYEPTAADYRAAYAADDYWAVKNENKGQIVFQDMRERYGQQFTKAAAGVDWAAKEVTKQYFYILAGGPVAEKAADAFLPRFIDLATTLGRDARMRVIAQTLQALSAQPAEENAADIIVNEQMSQVLHVPEGPTVEEAAAQAEGVETTASGAEEASDPASTN